MDECAPSASRACDEVVVKIEREPVRIVEREVTFPAPDEPEDIKPDPQELAARMAQHAQPVKMEIKAEPNEDQMKDKDANCESCRMKKRCRKKMCVLKKNQRKAVDKKNKAIQCHVCGKAFKFKSFLVSHLTVHNNERVFQCTCCSAKFKLKPALQRHMKTHKELPFRCSICERYFAHAKALGEHQRAAKCRRYECYLCGQYLKSGIQYLKYHMAAKHTGNKPHECRQCHQRFARTSHLKNHLAVHTNDKPFNCDICLKKFGHKTSLLRHSKLHPDELAFPCSKDCGQRFPNNETRMTHERRCKFVPKTCHICDKTFTAPSLLKAHLRSHSSRRDFPCKHCEKAFKSKDILDYHLKAHATELPFACDRCKRRFVSEKELKTHQGKCKRRQYECFVCKRSSQSKFNLEEHITSMHCGGLPFKCHRQKCSEEFQHDSDLRKHLQIHHNN